MSPWPQSLGKYQILGPLGRGGMGEVFKAHQPDLHRVVAIKTMTLGRGERDEFVERFRREARTAAALSHPGIVQIHDIGAEGELQYIVMEYVEGKSLKEVLSEGRLDLRRALRIAGRVADVLEYAHGRGVIHRDIKPANILLTAQDRVKILDFGLAKPLAEGKGLTATGVLIGTPQYMAPEQAFGAPEEVDARADLFSLGAVLYEMITGRPPFDGPTVLAVLRKLEEEDPPPPGLSPAVDALLAKALAKDPARRFQTASEMAGAIRTCLGGEAWDDAGGESIPVVSPRPARRVLLGVVAAAALLGIGLGIARVSWRRPKPPVVYVPESLAELRELLAAEGHGDVSEEDLRAYVQNPALRAAVARQRIRRGQFSRSLPDLFGYDRLIAEIASAGTLQRFFSPGLFRAWIKEPPGLRGAGVFLAAAFARHQENRQEAAREKLLAAAAAGAPSVHVLLVRAHLDLWEVYPDPAGEAARPVLGSLREDLRGHDDLFLLPLQALAAHLAGDAPAAWAAADRLRDRAPQAAETWILRSILFFREGRVGLAQDALGDAARLEPERLETTLLGHYLRLVEVLNDPQVEALDLAGLRRDLDERLKREHYPAALFLRGVLNALESRWEAAEEDFKKMVRRTAVDRIMAGHDLLVPFVQGVRGTRCQLLVAARDLQHRLGRLEAAVATALQITGVGLSEEERRRMLLENHRWLARALVGDPGRALRHVEEALRRGARPQELREDEGLGELRREPAFEDLLRRYE